MISDEAGELNEIIHEDTNYFHIEVVAMFNSNDQKENG